MPDTLLRSLEETIASDGPLSVEAFMTKAVATYYQRERVFGRDGDFITAPEISQVFGELIGVWFAMQWINAGQPKSFPFVECGPGRGTLIADALRGTAAVPGFHEAIDLHLVETSPTLRTKQAEALKGFPATWHDSIEDLPDQPLYLIGNEFLDALAIRQFVYVDRHWCERAITFQNGKCVFTLLKDTSPPDSLLSPLAAPKDGDIVEFSPATDDFITSISNKICLHGGAALLFDYGYDVPAYGDTLQAMANHGYVDVLERPGEVDITAHVNFSRAADLARTAGASVFGPTVQGLWLPRMGLEHRIQALQAQATGAQTHQLISGARRLIDPQSMGRLFKVLAVCPPGAPTPDGFTG